MKLIMLMWDYNFRNGFLYCIIICMYLFIYLIIQLLR